MRTLVPLLVFALFGPHCLAQQWREVTTPPTRHDLASCYELVAPLDPLDDPQKWQGASHAQSAQATTTVGEGRLPGSRALRVTYEFTGKEQLEYLDLAGAATVPEGAAAVGLWAFGGPQPLPLRLRLVDASGETFQYDLTAVSPGEWTLGVASLAHPAVRWGGNDDGKLDRPCRVASIVLDKLGSRYRAKGELRLAELGVYRDRPERLRPHGLKVLLPAARSLLVYEPGQAVELAVQADPGDRTLPPLPVTLQARLVDPFGRTAPLAEGAAELTLRLTGPDPTPLRFVAATPGAYDLELRLAGRGADLDAPWADVRLAVLPPPPPPGPASPFGVSTHFGQSWSAETVLPAVARAGITFYRDEMYWGGVEPQQGQLAIPDRFRDYVARGKALGLQPLIIADYTNKAWEPDGNFPLTAQSRAAYARYARFLVQQLPDVRYVEIWNEWCGGCGMGGRRGTAADYAPLFVESARAVREASPQATVVGIGGEGDGREFAAMMSGGAGAAMDAFSIHPYMYPGLPGQVFRNHLQKAAADAQAAAGKPVPLWITEIGWPTNTSGNGSSFLHQARCLVRMMVIALSSGTEKVVWYDFLDDGDTLAYNEHNFGLVHNPAYSLAPKPAYVAYAHLIGLLSGRKLQRQELTPEGLWRTVYEGGGARVTVLWAAEQGQQLVVPLAVGERAEDLFGRPLADTAQVTVTWDPVFVTSRP